MQTLLITAIASAAAAYVTSQLWAPGTLAAATFTPVLVALLKELLAKPAEVVTRAVPVRGVVRSAPSAGEPEELRRDTPEAIEERIAQLGEAPGVSRPRRRRNWQIAVVTGLLGFLIAAVIITVPELVAGSSAAGGGRDTTFFGGKKRASGAPTDTTTTTTPGQTEEEAPGVTVTEPPAETVTVPPPAPTPVPDEQQAPPPAEEEETPEAPATPGSPQPPAPPG